MAQEAAHELDASGLPCPLPVLHARHLLKSMKSGDVLCVISSEAGAVQDFHDFSRLTGHPVQTRKRNDGKYELLIQKKFASA